jgi:ArsR family transcriptional regulator, arsenate/arsenite/antimonite-responsive transcriptional repressor
MFRHVDGSAGVPEAVSNLLLALSDERRQRVLGAFVEARTWELAATEIARHCAPLSRTAVSHHLGVMRRTGVLTSRRDGKHIFYAIDRAYIEQALQSVLAFLDVCCAPPDACAGAVTTAEEAGR